MKSDERVQQVIQEELRWDPSFRASSIGVAVANGIATLSGMVDSIAAKRAAERTAWSAPGITRVENNLQIETPEFADEA